MPAQLTSTAELCDLLGIPFSDQQLAAITAPLAPGVIVAGAGSGNVRNGTRPKTVLTENTGQVQIEVPRDRAGTFVPQIVKKRQRQLSGVDEIVLSLYAKGLTTGEISAHFAEIYGGVGVEGDSLLRSPTMRSTG